MQKYNFFFNRQTLLHKILSILCSRTYFLHKKCSETRKHGNVQKTGANAFPHSLTHLRIHTFCLDRGLVVCLRAPLKKIICSESAPLKLIKSSEKRIYAFFKAFTHSSLLFLRWAWYSTCTQMSVPIVLSIILLHYFPYPSRYPSS